MKSLSRLLVGLGTAAVTSAVFAGPASAAPAPAPATPSHHPAASAPVFVQNDATSGNTVFVYDRGADGSLTEAGHYATGGLGAALPDSVVDHLAGQGSLTYDPARQVLYAVNAGSNTVTVFAVRGDQLQRVQVVSAGGQFPLSVTAHGAYVFVLNGQNGGSVEGYLNLAGRLIPVSHRELGLPTTSPAGTPRFLTAPGQVTFSPDGHRILVTTKGNGTVEVFRVGPFAQLGRPVVTADTTGAANNVPFDVSFDRSGAVYVAEAGANTVARYRLNRDDSLSLIDRIATGQQATCWIVAGRQALYASNAGSGTLTTVQGNGALRNAGTTATDAGVTDATVTSDGRNLYVQTGANGIVDEFSIGHDGSLASIGSVTVPDAVGAEGIASA